MKIEICYSYHHQKAKDMVIGDIAEIVSNSSNSLVNTKILARTFDGYLDLENFEKTWHFNQLSDIEVVILPKGTKITINI